MADTSDRNNTVPLTKEVRDAGKPQKGHCGVPVHSAMKKLSGLPSHPQLVISWCSIN